MSRSSEGQGHNAPC